MDKTPTQFHKKKPTGKKLDQLLKNIQGKEQIKQFHPGQIAFNTIDYPHDKSRVVNFFGDVNTKVFTLKVHQNDNYVAAGCSNGEVKVYNIAEGKVMNIGSTSRLSGYPCTGLKWKPKKVDQYVTCNCDGTIKWYNRKQQAAYNHFQNQQKGYLCCQYQCMEQWCAFGTDSSQIEIFDNQKMKPIHVYIHGGADELTSNHHNNRVFSIKCLPEDKNIFFSGGWDSTLQIWDIRMKKESIRKIYGPTISADSLDYRNGTILAGNYRNKDILELWDFKSGNLIETLDIKQPINGNSYGFAASFAHKSEQNYIAVALSGSNKVKILKNKKVVSQMQFQAAPLAIDFLRHNDKDFIIVGGVEGTIYVIKIKQA